MYCHDVFRGRREFQKNMVLEIPVSRKEKRYRTAFTTEELNYLEQEYKTCPYSTQARLTEISNVIEKPEKVIKVWFQNRRSREKKTNTNEKYKDGKNTFDVIAAKTLEEKSMSNSSKNYTQFANTNYRFPNQSPDNGTSEKREINPINRPNIESYSASFLNNKNITSARICPETNYTKINNQYYKVHNKSDRTTMLKSNVCNDNINRKISVNICKAKSKTQNKTNNLLNHNTRQKLPNIRGNSLATFAVNRQQEVLQNFNTKRIDKNITHIKVDPNYHFPDNVSSMHKKTRAGEPQINCICNCKPVREHRQKDLAIPYVIVIPCFK